MFRHYHTLSLAVQSSRQVQAGSHDEGSYAASLSGYRDTLTGCICLHIEIV